MSYRSKNICHLLKIDFKLLYETQNDLPVLKREKERSEKETRFLHTKVDREKNFENKASISLKVKRWHSDKEFSDEKIKEAEKIQVVLNEIYYQAEMKEEAEFTGVRPIAVPLVIPKENVIGLGPTSR